MTDRPPPTTEEISDLFQQDENSFWARQLGRLTSDLWEDDFVLLWKVSPLIQQPTRAVAFLFTAYRELEDDFARASTLLLLARISLFIPEDQRILIYESIMALEHGQNAFLRSKTIQLAGLFSHILDNSMLVAGQLAARRPETNPFCAMAHARALRRAYLVRPDPTLMTAIGRYENSPDIRVRAEAHVQSASVRLVRSISANDRTDFSTQLEDIALSLNAALALEPDRPDALRLKTVTQACQALIATPIDRSRLSRATSELRSSVHQSLSDLAPIDSVDEAFDSERLLVEAVERVSSILEQTESLPRSLDASAGLISIAEAAVFLGGLGDLGFGTGSPTEVAMSVLLRQGFQRYVDTHVKRSLWTGLQHAKAKVQTLLAGNLSTSSPESAAYLTGVLDVFIDIESGAVNRFDPGLIVALARAMPSKTAAEIKQSLVEHQTNGSLDGYLLDVLQQTITAPSPYRVREFWGGHPKAQRILQHLQKELMRHVPQAPTETLANFLNVARHVMSYLFAVSERKFSVPFLMSKAAGGKGESALEADLEDSLHHFLLNSDIAFAVRRQLNAATGRADIVFNFGHLFFPLELKREEVDISREHLRDAYLAQAASYARAYEGLALFLVLDLTPKPRAEPLVDLENLVWISEVAPRPNTTTLQIVSRTFVVTFVIPGNQPRPSDLSSS